MHNYYNVYFALYVFMIEWRINEPTNNRDMEWDVGVAGSWYLLERRAKFWQKFNSFAT